ncbi:MAG: sigma-70 family RNA polymerase sigma factor [Cyanobium sp.]
MNPSPPKSHLSAPAPTPAPAPSLKAEAPSLSLSQRNQIALSKLVTSGDAVSWRRQRDALVRDNLPLVYAMAGRMSRPGSLPYDDLTQVGSLGLLRAIEAFKPSEGNSLSSFAVPYIRGAMQHELRDRHSLMKIPRELWELRRQATVLQERNRLERRAPLALGALARSLGCESLKLEEAMGLHRVTEMRSLDAPSLHGSGTDETTTLLENLADPASLHSAEPEETEQPISAQGRWLRQQLASLPQLEQDLILGHLTSNATWVELGRELGIQPRQAQRRYKAGMNRLEQQASQWPEVAAAESTGSVERQGKLKA